MSQSTVSLRLVALDLDGTLLNHQSGISPLTRQAIAAAVSHGVVVLPATGRPLASLPPVVAQLPGIRAVIRWAACTAATPTPPSGRPATPSA